MRSFKRSLVVTLILVLALCSFVEYVDAQQADLFPWVRFSGGFATTAASLTVDGTVSEMDYQNGDVWVANVAGVETIKGAKVAINGATRTGDYSFNGDILDPNDVTLTIKTLDESYTYLEATLTDASFSCDTAFVQTCWLNEFLDANNEATLNLINIVLATNDGVGGPGSGPYPSRYIDELAAYLTAVNASGMKMSLLLPPIPGNDFTGNSSGPITFGLIDGLQSLTPPNSPPMADGGATTTGVPCFAVLCDIILDGSDSSDPDGIADIVSYDWYEGATHLGSGVTLPVTLTLGSHDITLIVTDQAGATDEALIPIVIDPAELSFIEIDNAKVKRDGKVKIHGRLALPAGVSHLNVNSIGRAIIDIPSIGLPGDAEIDESVDFVERKNGNKWKYKASSGFGISKFRIDWTGSKFNYNNGLFSIVTSHIGEDETELSITSCSAVTVTIDGVEIVINANDEVSCSLGGVKLDGDNDGDSDDSDSDGGNSADDGDDCTVGVRLPFALTADMPVTISGAVTDSMLVGDYFSAAVGKFKLHGRFDASGVTFSTLSPKQLDLTVALGNEGFHGTLVIDELTWTKIKSKYWKFKLD